MLVRRLSMNKGTVYKNQAHGFSFTLNTSLPKN